MFRIVRDRFVALVSTLLFASVIVFLLMQLVPGDPAIVIAGEQASVERVEEVRQELGLNDPLHVQYGRWMGGVLQGDLGSSVITGDPVADSVWRTLPRTAAVVFAGLLLAVALGVPLGVLAALRRGSWIDATVRVLATLGLAVPSFWLGLMLIAVFALELRWLPAGGYASFFEEPAESIVYLLLPAIAIGSHAMSEIARQTRSAMLEILGADHIRTLTAMGISRSAVIWRHAVKSSSIPIVTVIGLDINRAVGTAVVIEIVFGIHGVGTLLVDATHLRDFPVVQGVILATVVWVVITNLFIDVIYRVLDPRIRQEVA